MFLDKENEIKAQDYLTFSYYTEHKEDIWNFHYTFADLVKKNKPGPSHEALADLQCFYDNLPNKKMTLATQNIDNYHVEAYYNAKIKNNDKFVIKSGLDDMNFGFCPGVYEIHGNTFHMRCENECSIRLFKTPENQKIPKCPKCGQVCRPHTLLFDESYSEKYYRSDTVNQIADQMDAIVVIGTALETNMARNLVCKAIGKKFPVIEINPNPFIGGEKTLHIAMGSKEALPKLCKLIKGHQAMK